MHNQTHRKTLGNSSNLRQGYEAYAYGAAHDPSFYAYGAYAGYAQYPQQVSY